MPSNFSHGSVRQRTSIRIGSVRQRTSIRIGRFEGTLAAGTVSDGTHAVGTGGKQNEAAERQ